MQAKASEPQIDFYSQKSHQTIVTEENPIVKTESSENLWIRINRWIDQAKEHQWISQFDIYSLPLKLNINGEDTFKTEFGGCVYLIIAIISIFFTFQTQMPNGLQLKAPITKSTLVLDNGAQNIWIYDTIFCMNIRDIKTNLPVNLTDPLFKKRIHTVKLYYSQNGQSYELQMDKNNPNGMQYCFTNSPTNQKAVLYGNSIDNDASALIQIQILACNINDPDPQLWNYEWDMSDCMNIVTYYDIEIRVYNQKEVTGDLQPYTQDFQISIGDHYTIFTDRRQFTTNNNFFGHIANIFSYQLDYYYFNPFGATGNTLTSKTPNFTSDMVCSTLIAFSCTGNTDIVTQNFDDITAVLVFFLSLSQTLFLIAYFLFLKQYTTNSMYLYIADNLVYIKNLKTNRHHNFKSGIYVFIACLMHKHHLIEAIDVLLYKFFQTNIRQHLASKIQLTMEMIEYGEQSMRQKSFFDQINSIYEQQNTQPSKITINFVQLEKQIKQQNQSKKQQKQNFDEDKFFLTNQQRAAFRLMCQEHQYYSPEKKQHLASILKINNKSFKLINLTQKIYNEYLQIIKSEAMLNEFDIPLKQIQIIQDSAINLQNKKI